ncbi:MAG: GntR family transcriptional regulator [bacterium]|nr:GntR family transcriptional regulator [bacterium]
MTILIDNRSGVPIYNQICQQIRSAILGGELEADAPLPSIRNLAKDLRISVITTKRAYEELEREGLIYTVAGVGCFVARQNAALLHEQTLRQIESHLREAVRLAAGAGVSRGELDEILDIFTEDTI